MPTPNVVLTAHQDALVGKLMDGGRYQNAGEVLRAQGASTRRNAMNGRLMDANVLSELSRKQPSPAEVDFVSA